MFLSQRALIISHVYDEIPQYGPILRSSEFTDSRGGGCVLTSFEVAPVGKAYLYRVRNQDFQRNVSQVS